MSSKESFLSASNTNLLRKIITDHIDKKYDIIDIFEKNDVFDMFDKQRIVTSETTKDDDTVLSLNKRFLSNIVPQIYTIIPSTKTADDSIKAFYNTDVNTNENLKGTKVIQQEEKQPDKKIISSDLDISSADRLDYGSSTSSSMTPYKFDVQFSSSDTNKNISTHETFKNVVGINLTHIIITDTNEDLYSITKYSHLFLQIDEFSGVYTSTSDHGRKALVKLVRDTDWDESSTSNVRYHLMNTKRTGGNSAVGWSSETPISSLSKLSIKILTPNGFELKSRSDTFSISSVTETSSTFQLTCATRFEPGAVHAGNRMTFQAISTENVDVGNYLNNGGEFIVSSVVNDQVIVITKNVESYDGTGSEVYDDFSSGTFAVTDYKGMNISVQTSLGLQIKTVETTNFNNYASNIV